MSEDHSGAAHDARWARCSTPRATTPRAGGPTSRSSRPAPSTATQGAKLPARAPRARRRARRAPAPADVGDRRAAARAGFFAAKGVLGAALDAVRVPWEVAARDRAVPASRAQRARARRRRGRRLDRRAAPARRARVGPRPRRRAASRSTSTACSRTPTRCRATSTSRASPSCAWTSRWSLADDVPAALVLSIVRAGGRRAAGRRARLRPLPRRAGGGGAQVAGARARLPRARPHADRRGRRAGARAHRRRAARATWAASCVPSVIVAGASGYTGALAAALLARHPRFDLVAITSRSDVGTRLSDLYPHHRVPLTLEEFDAERHGQADAAIVAYPHGAAAPVVAALRERGVRVVDLSADFRLRLVDIYEQWYVAAPAPRAPRRGRLRAARAAPRRRSRAPTSSPTPAASRPRRCWRWRRWRRGSSDVVIDAKTGVSGAGRRRRRPRTSSRPTRTSTPYGVGRPPPRARDRPGAGLRSGAPIRATFVPHLVPLDQGELVSCYCTLRERRSTSTRSSRDAYADEPFVELADRPPGRARRARHEHLPHPRALGRAHAARSSSSPRSTTCGRAPRRRRSRTST